MSALTARREETSAHDPAAAAKPAVAASSPALSEPPVETSIDDGFDGRRFYRRAMAHFVSTFGETNRPA